MADQKLELNIVTPERLMVADKVDQVNVPGSEGDLGILYDHSPLLTAMRSGPLSYEKNGEVVSLIVSGGYLEVTDNRVTVLAETAEFAHDVDRERAERARIEAEKALENTDISEDEFNQVQLKLFRAMARLEHTSEK